MKRSIRFALSTASLCAALSLAGTAPARGQVFFRGAFPVPHGRVAVGFGVPGLAVNAFVPDPYLGEIYYLPGYGYGFDCDAGWVPVRRFANRWIVARRPFVIEGHRAFVRRGGFGLGLARRDRDARRFAAGRGFDRGFDRGRRFERRSGEGFRSTRRVAGNRSGRRDRR